MKKELINALEKEMTETPQDGFSADWSFEDRYHEFFVDKRDNNILSVTPYAVSILRKRFPCWELSIGDEKLTIRDMLFFNKSKRPHGIISKNKENIIVSFDKSLGTLITMAGDLATVRNNF